MNEGQPQPRRIPRFLSCLVKGPLGCLAFLVGAVAVLVLFLPPALGRLLDRTAEDWFSQHFAGQLELGEAWLGSLYGPQRIERLILRDPHGDEVLRGSLEAPSLDRAFDGPRHRYGPVRLRIELLRLVATENGASNLELALEPVLSASAEPTRGKGVNTDVPFEFLLELVVERMRFSVGDGSEEVLEDLVFQGTLEWGPDSTHLVLEGGSGPDVAEPLRARIELERPEFGPRRPWTSKLSLQGAPTALARTLCPAFRPLAGFAGPRLDELEWSHPGQILRLRCSDEGALFELTGIEEEGLVRSGEVGSVRASLPCTGRAGRVALLALLPCVASVDCEEGSGVHRLELQDFAWPLGGDPSEIEGALQLELAPLRATPLPVLATLLGANALAFPPKLAYGLREGELEYAGLRLERDDGWLEVRGTQALASGECELELVGEGLEPVRLSGRSGALAPEPEATEVTVPVPPEAPSGEAAPIPAPIGG